MFLPLMIIPLIFSWECPILTRTSGPATWKLGLLLMDASLMALKFIFARQLLVALQIARKDFGEISGYKSRRKEKEKLLKLAIPVAANPPPLPSR